MTNHWTALQTWAILNVGSGGKNELFDLVNAIVKAERKACADLVLYRFEPARDTGYDAGFEAARSTFALAILARSSNSN